MTKFVEFSRNFFYSLKIQSQEKKVDQCDIIWGRKEGLFNVTFQRMSFFSFVENVNLTHFVCDQWKLKCWFDVFIWLNKTEKLKKGDEYFVRYFESKKKKFPQLQRFELWRIFIPTYFGSVVRICKKYTRNIW